MKRKGCIFLQIIAYTKTFSRTYRLSKLNGFLFPPEIVSKLKSMGSSSVTDSDFQELRNSFPASFSVIRGTQNFVESFTLDKACNFTVTS